MNNNILLKESLPKLFLKFVLPAILSMVLAGCQSMIDGLFLGRFASTNAMASVNIAIPYMQLIIGSSMVICTGTLSFLGRTLGENSNQQKAKDIFKTSVISLFIISIIVAFIGIFFSKPLAILLGANNVLLEGTSQYIKVIAFFVPFISFMFLFGFIGRLLEKPHLYLIASIVGVIGNIVMDFIAIKLLGLGTIGAALATGVAYLLGFFVVMPSFLSKKSILNIYEGKFYWYMLKNSAYNGSSEGVTSISTAVTMLLFNTAFIKYAGENGVAAFTVINYVSNFVILVMFGIADGIGSIVSYNYGARKLQRVKNTLNSAIILNFLIGGFIFLILNIFSQNLVTIFIKDDKFVIDMAVNGAHLYSFAFLLNGFNIIQSAYQTAIGNALYSAIISASRGLIFIFVGIFLLPFIFSLKGVWLTVPFAEMSTIFICYLIYIYENKIKK